jgi:hypothetical protein
MGETQIIAPLSQLLQPPLVVSGLEAIGNYQHTPTHKQRGDGCASGIATQERTNIR